MKMSKHLGFSHGLPCAFSESMEKQAEEKMARHLNLKYPMLRVQDLLLGEAAWWFFQEVDYEKVCKVFYRVIYYPVYYDFVICRTRCRCRKNDTVSAGCNL